MKAIDVVQTIRIDADPGLVRQQFADVEHHAESGVHRGVSFEVDEDDGSRCRYRQATRVGPVRLVQHLELDRSEDGPLVNHIRRGQFSGGWVAFDVRAAPDGASLVEATLHGPLTGPQRVLGRLLRRRVAAALRGALAEDRADIESGAYALAAGRGDQH